jgi:hypothetical protein
VNKSDLTKSFTDNGYVVIKNFIPKDIVQLTLDNWKVFEESETFDGILKYESYCKSFGSYCFPPAVGMHFYVKEKMKDFLDIRLKETYPFARKYTRDADLARHKDRPSCEISMTTCLDYKTDNKKPWEICLDAKSMVQCSLDVGDILIYRGFEIPHWREKLEGDYSYHMFLHYYDMDGELESIIDYDGRKNAHKFNHRGNEEIWKKMKSYEKLFF